MPRATTRQPAPRTVALAARAQARRTDAPALSLKPPPRLTGEGLAAWREAVEFLGQVGRLHRVDQALLAAYATAAGVESDQAELLREFPAATADGVSGVFSAWRAAAMTLASLAFRLGLDAAHRHRDVTLAEDSAAQQRPNDPLAELRLLTAS